MSVLSLLSGRRHKARSAPASKRRGGAILETVLILPVLLYLAFGTIEFGYYFYVKHSLEGAARDGCRAMIVSGATLTDVTNAVTSSMNAAGLQNSGYTIYVGDGTVPPYPAMPPQVTTANQASCAVGDTMSVYVFCTWSTVGQGYRPWNMIGGTKVVYGQAVMRKES